MKGTEVPSPRHSSACDCTCVLTRIDHCGHTFLRHIDLLNSIACTTVLHFGHTFLNVSQGTVTWSQLSQFNGKLS